MTAERKPIPWNIDAIIRRKRNADGWSLSELSAETAHFHPEGTAVSPAHINRIERGLADPSLSEFYAISRALRLSPQEIVPWGQAPWFVIRRAAWLSALNEDLQLKREGSAHHVLHEKNVYKYVPLDPPIDGGSHGDDGPKTEAALPALSKSDPEEYGGIMDPMMRKYIFKVSSADDELVKEGADSHPGEELIWILEGKIELWMKDPAGEASDDFKRFELEAGDSVQYSALIPHAYRSIGDEDALALFVFADLRRATPEGFTRKGEEDE